MKLLFATAALLALAVPLAAANAQAVPPVIAAALADASRPDADKARDAARHPGEVLAFMGVKPGDKVADFLVGGGYWTRILSAAVGPSGHVYAYQGGEFIQYRAAYATEQDTAVAGRANVTPSRESLAAVAFPEPLDAIITVENYHDLHLALAPADNALVTTKKLYAALKPGGLFLVVDHVAAADPTFAVPNKLHRIDPMAARLEIETAGFKFLGSSRLYANPDPDFKAPNTLHRINPAAARAEIEKAGFRFVASSPLLANPADKKDAMVFSPAIRGKTDQFIYLFRKPG